MAEKDSEQDSAKSEGSIVVTSGGAFKVEGSPQETLRRLAAEDWVQFTLAGQKELVFVRSSEVVAVQSAAGTRGRLGF
jgi:hypothetical protein